MRSVKIITIVLAAGVLMPLTALAQLPVEGAWTAYSPTQLPSYSLREHQNPGAAPEAARGDITFAGDGGFQSDFLGYTDWQESDGFLVLSEDDTQSFFAVRQLNEDAVVLTNLTVTEQNRRIINIRVHRPESLLLLRQ